jgi:hypothetical protein
LALIVFRFRFILESNYLRFTSEMGRWRAQLKLPNMGKCGAPIWCKN